MYREEYYSNCLLEAIKAKLRYGKQIKLIYIKPKDNEVRCPHWLWYDSIDDNVYDWHCDYTIDKWWKLIWFRGYIRIRPYDVYKRWESLKNNKRR